MNENYRCGDHGALIAFVYGECEPAEHDAVAAHLADCASCAGEIDALRSTRGLLAAWTPPETSLGFRVTSAVAAAPAPVLRPAAWWRQPLPAWAQAAAAVLIFAAGMTAGGARQQAAAPSPVAAVVPPAPAARATAVPAGLVSTVSRDDLAGLERRLRAMETARTQTVSIRPAAAAVDEAALMERVEALLATSEARQQSQSATIVEAIARNLAAQRQYDLQQIQKLIGEFYSTTDATLRQHSTAISSLASVSFSQPASAR
jgi:hypothetical protein